MFTHRAKPAHTIPKEKQREPNMKGKQEREFRILEFRENKFDIIGDVHGCYDELM